MNPAMLAALQSGGVTIDPSLRLYIPFNEGVGAVAKDYSQYGNNGVLTDVKWGINCGVFNGTSSYVNCGNDASLNMGTTDFTLETWIKTTGTANSNVIKKRTGAQWYSWRLNYTAGKMDLETAYVVSAVSSAVVNDGVWHHIVVIKSGTTATHYTDGVESGSGTVSNDVSNTADLIIGAYFNGSIDAVRIYNRALSTLKIKNDYEAERGIYGV